MNALILSFRDSESKAVGRNSRPRIRGGATNPSFKFHLTQKNHGPTLDLTNLTHRYVIAQKTSKDPNFLQTLLVGT